ncbi:MAG: sigma 54-interacting transcriptional regulator [Myxococcota bacterium]|nr:sigma 54-interacting transcriptional regulator [Myxococcota bacterium]MDW8361101.1 sigma 54-interacting transcriptional regulator [Myxococcales bacterium]
MDALLLRYQGNPIREFPIGDRVLEIGSGSCADVVVHDRSVPARALVVWREQGLVRIEDVRGERRSGSRPWPVGERVRLGTFEVERVADVAPSPARTPCTEPLIAPSLAREPLAVVVGRGAEARRRRLDGRPTWVGTAPDNDLVLVDPTVSARHCRFEMLEGAWIVRDLGSRNGTWVDGVRISVARIGAGTRLRVGRTDLWIVPRGEPGDARATGLVAVSPAMLELLGEVERLARYRWPVLVLGESGAGKEGIARALHDRGPRASGPFVAVNAGGLPRELVESELFGHERGAFTGAVAARRGAFEQADGGTLFLDEIGELSIEMQSRLLRVIETGEVRRVGAEATRRVDVRLVCATHRDVAAMVASGGFRRDLYYRIAHEVVRVPPLRERPEDVVPLAEHFLLQIQAEVGRRVLAPQARERLRAHRWPGNVRELRNVVCAAAGAAASEVVEAIDVERALARVASLGEPPRPEQLWQRTVERCGGNVSKAARALGLPRSTLRDRLRRAAALEPASEDAPPARHDSSDAAVHRKPAA